MFSISTGYVPVRRTESWILFVHKARQEILASAHERHGSSTPHWTMSSSSLLPTTCSPSSTSTRSMSSPMYPGASYYMKGRCGGTPHARHVRQHHRRRRPWVRGPQPLRLFICSSEQPPSLLRADLAADQTTKLRSLARSKYVATAPRNIN